MSKKKGTCAGGGGGAHCPQGLSLKVWSLHGGGLDVLHDGGNLNISQRFGIGRRRGRHNYGYHILNFFNFLFFL